FGLVPAWQATRVEINSVLSRGTRRLTSHRSPLRSALVIVELALALVLLTGAGLLGKAFWRLTSVDPGFKPEGLVTMRIDLPAARYKDVPRQTQFREQALENMNSLTGVESAMISELPLGGNAINHNFVIDGRAPFAVGEEPELYNRSIAGDYFRVMGIPLLRGRAFSPNDTRDALLVGVKIRSARASAGPAVKGCRGSPSSVWSATCGTSGSRKRRSPPSTRPTRNPARNGNAGASSWCGRTTARTRPLRSSSARSGK
ncbi:MAG: hypothetical protein M3032_00495, partial [Verrucomicrobiota bacterium]|nr:hypothetical protein [Verrucomicrobiota bacterium]